MSRAYWSEWLKLRQPGTILGGAGSMIAFAILTILLTLTQLDQTTTGRGPNGGGPNGGPTITAAQVAAHTGFAALIPNSASFLGLVALVLFAIAIGTEYSNGTLRNLLVRQPKRLQLLAGKLLAVGSFVVLAAVVAVGAGFVAALVLTPGHGVSTAAWFTGDGRQSILATTGNLVLSTIAWGMLGAIIALALRSTTAAIAIGLAYVLIVENLLTAAWSGGKQWLPGQLFSAIANGGNSSIGYGAAVAHVAVYLVVGVIAAAWLFSRRDVAA